MDTNDTRPDLAPSSGSLWIVIAAFNEARRIGSVLDGVLRVARNVVVVDDGSTDGTSREVLKRNVWLLVHPANLGQGAALQTGIEFALTLRATSIVTFDADGQHQPEDIPRMIAMLEANGADFALGSRFLGQADGIPLSRKYLLRLSILFTRALSGVKLSDAHNGLRAMTRRGAERINLRFNRMEHASEFVDQIARSGLKFVEVPVRIVYSPDTLAKGQRTAAAFGLGVRLLLDRILR